MTFEGKVVAGRWCGFRFVTKMPLKTSKGNDRGREPSGLDGFFSALGALMEIR